MPNTSTRSRVLVRALLAGAVLAALLTAAPAQAQRIGPTFWGMHDTDWASTPGVPVGSANLTTSRTYWKDVEKSPIVPGLPNYDLSRLEAQVSAAERAGARPMVVLGFTPRHHSSQPGAPDYYAYMPEDLDAWRSYVTAVALTFGTRLDYQIWPEPNITGNWKGTPAQMARLTQVASDAIDDVIGDAATVVSPAVAVRLRSQRTWMTDFFSTKVDGRSVASFVDVVALDPFPKKTGRPEDSYALVKKTRKRLARLGVRKPIWNNEINYGVEGANQPTDVQYGEATSRAYVIRTYVLSAAAGLRRTYWLGWFNTPTLGIQMVDSSGDTAAAGEAYQVVHDWMSGTTFKSCRVDRRGRDKGLRTCALRESKREVRRVLWTTGRPVKVKVHRTSRAWEDQEGRRHSKRGAFRLRLTGKPVMVVSRR